MRTRAPSQGRATSKKGMGELVRIVLDLQRDVKRVAKAISPQGAQAMVEQHNAKYPDKPQSQWTYHNEDINGDNIPDVVIRNANNEPLYVNGYTTAKRDWPARLSYYTRYPTSSARKEAARRKITMGKHVKDLYGIQYNDDFNGDFHELGRIANYQKPEVWRNYQLDNYKGVPKEKSLSAYDRFKRYVIGEKLNDALEWLDRNHYIYIPNKLKIRIFSKVTADLWKHWILGPVAAETEQDVESAAFEKYKKSRDGKTGINNTVSNFLNHLYLTNETVGWTEDRRAALEQEFDDSIKDCITFHAEQLEGAEEAHGHHDENDYNVDLPEHMTNFNQHVQPAHQWSEQTYHNFGGATYEHQPMRFRAPVQDPEE